MKKAQKRQAEDFIKLLSQAHDEIKRLLESHSHEAAMELLGQCQEGAVSLGDLIEKTEGEGFQTIPLLEAYCELVYQIHEEIAGGAAVSPNQTAKRLRKSLIPIENSVRNAIKTRMEVVFFPYKASMWDSLESIWRAADEDPDCDAYVVPIPYYDRKPDGSFDTCHYEGGQLSAYVPVVHYDAYHMEERMPDVVYIHNPYDDVNYVTSVHPVYYSAHIKKFTDCLVYVPYYATAGGMSEAQAMCPAYIHADYIVIQSEKYKKFFDPGIPDKKFLVMGSPKFDSVIHKCQNPPTPPADWVEKMKGRTVYFYNTSLAGMLGNTDAFLNKMRYVFDTFRGRDDACLLWRPHPLLESTFDSMRKPFKPRFEALRDAFIREGWGIYDKTPDIESTIALSDVYIGDAGTSVTSLFGVAGKPLFILNNMIDSLPEKDDWRGERIRPALDIKGNDRYQVTDNNQLWFSENNDYHYTFYMDLESGYSGGAYYMRAIETGDTVYVVPRNAQHILIIQNKKIVKKICFKDPISCAGAFHGCWYNENYIFLFPFRYPYVIRFAIKTETVNYIDGINAFNVRYVEGEWQTGGVIAYRNELVFASPTDSRFVFLDVDTLQIRVLASHSASNLGTQAIVPDEDTLWLLPLNGMTLTRWNPKTGETQEYSELPEGFRSIRWPQGYVCEERPFSNMAFSEREENKIIISPGLGNMYLSLDRKTGEMKEWKLPVQVPDRGKNGYYLAWGLGAFTDSKPRWEKAGKRIWHAPERKLYEINIDTKEYKEIDIEFDYTDLLKYEPGFAEASEWMQYCLSENAFHSLKDLLDNNISGAAFDRERQLKAFSKVNVNTDGTCGRNVHDFVKGTLS